MPLNSTLSSLFTLMSVAMPHGLAYEDPTEEGTQPETAPSPPGAIDGL